MESARSVPWFVIHMAVPGKSLNRILVVKISLSDQVHRWSHTQHSHRSCKEPAACWFDNNPFINWGEPKCAEHR